VASMLTAGVVSADDGHRALLRASLLQTGLVQSVADWNLGPDQYPASADYIPDVVLLELGPDLAASLPFAAHLHRLRPSLSIIACSPSQQPSPDLLMKAMRSGIREFLPEPIDPTELRETLERVIQEHGLAQAAGKKLIAVLGSKGGVGTTMVAVNLGVEIAQLSGKRTILLDFARPLGRAWLWLNLQPHFSVRDAIEDLDRMDGHVFGGLLTAHKSGLQLLAGASHSDVWDRISGPVLGRIVNVAQSISDFVIADLGSVYSSECASVFKLARIMVLVAEADVASLWALEHHLSVLTSFGVDPKCFRVVINRWHSADERALKALERKRKNLVLARLPNDFQCVSEAANLGVSLFRNQGNPLRTRFRSLASEFISLQQPQEHYREAV
jgi:pilus assembly protein CpaE